MWHIGSRRHGNPASWEIRGELVRKGARVIMTIDGREIGMKSHEAFEIADAIVDAAEAARASYGERLGELYEQRQARREAQANA